MLPRKTSRRQRKAYEREWRDYYVDKNIEDDWLERLNSLAAFDLISICEGHCNRQPEPLGTPPHVKLRVKESYLPGIGGRWDRHKMVIISTASDLFQTGNTYLNVEMGFRLKSGTGRLNYQEALVVRVHRGNTKPSSEMDEETRQWFEQSVGQIEELDRVFACLWRDSSPGHAQEKPQDTDSD